MNLSKKLIISFVFSILVSIIIISIISSYMINNTFDSYLESEQRARFDSIYEEINSLYSGSLLDANEMSLMHYVVIEGIEITIKDSSGNIVYDSNYNGMGMGMNRRRMNMMHQIPAGNYKEITYDLYNDNKVICTLVIGYLDNSYITDSSIIFMDTLKRSLLASGIFAIIIGILVSIVLSRQLTKPIASITNTANKLRDGDLSARSEVINNTTEISQLTESINYLGDTLSKQDIIRKRYASDISHELRTPLTTLKTHLEAISDGIWEANDEHIEILMAEVTRLTKLVDDLKSSFTEEEYSLKINKTEFNISKELDSIITSFEPLFTKENYLIESKIEDNIIINMDKEKFNQIINNLLSNSLRYLNKDGKVVITLDRLRSDIILKLSDNGIGIKEEDLKNIFNRFYRADISRNKTTGGTGLGLAIVKSIVEAHNGQINVRSQYGKGTEFIITLPLE